ncbi:hypothetical protein HYW41_00295 [Candidatus Daviesbacteria bacterium]|nr:hypothetical protein [Candidatus Daviesbacteria bacterium]
MDILVGLTGIAAVGTAAKLGYDRLHSGLEHFPDEQTIFPKDAQSTSYLSDTEQDTFGTLQRVENQEPLDPNYLPKLLEQLRVNKGSVETRAKAVVDNIYRTGSGSTSLMIDEGGIFLAAGHTYQQEFLGARVSNIRGVDTLIRNLPSSLYTIPRTLSRNE